MSVVTANGKNNVTHAAQFVKLHCLVKLWLQLSTLIMFSCSLYKIFYHYCTFDILFNQSKCLQKLRKSVCNVKVMGKHKVRFLYNGLCGQILQFPNFTVVSQVHIMKQGSNWQHQLGLACLYLW